MKKLIMAMLIAVSMVQSVSAQDNNRQRMTPRQRTEQRIRKLDEKLSLTDEQKNKIRDLYANFDKQKYPKEKRREAKADNGHYGRADIRPAGALQANAEGRFGRKTEKQD